MRRGEDKSGVEEVRGKEKRREEKEIEERVGHVALTTSFSPFQPHPPLLPFSLHFDFLL